MKSIEGHDFTSSIIDYPVTSVDAQSILAISIDQEVILAFLFDVVDNQYRLIGKSASHTTIKNPFNDVQIGIVAALIQLQKIIDRPLLDKKHKLIHPTTGNGFGVDMVVVTISAGPPLNILVAGLLPEISLKSSINLAKTTYHNEILKFATDRKKDQSANLNRILEFKPDIVIISGGTDDGATESVLQLYNQVLMTCLLIPEQQRPVILFTGNRALQKTIKSLPKTSLDIHFASNIRPGYDKEVIVSGCKELTKLTCNIRSNQIRGLNRFLNQTQAKMTTSASGFSQIIKFLSTARSPDKGVMGIDIGTTATTVTAAFNGTPVLGVYTDLGLHSDLSGLIATPHFTRITQWLPMHVEDKYVQAYLLNKQLHPGLTPVTEEDLAIEQALVRFFIQTAYARIFKSLPPQLVRSYGNPPYHLEPIIGTGEIFSNAPTDSHSLLMLLDSIQPKGATTFVLDKHRIAAALGACAEINPTLTVQVLDSNAFSHLGTVISPIGSAKPGSPILRGTLIDEDNYKVNLELTCGSIEWIPLARGKTAELHINPLQKFDIGLGGPGIGGKLLVKGGSLGVVFDGRGRPIVLPSDIDERITTINSWRSSFGG